MAEKFHPAISVVIPVKDRKESLLRAIRSVLNQTCPVKQIVVVDDGSKESVVDAINAIAPQIVCLRNEVSMGAPHARNRGWRHCSSELIAFLDSDDEFMPDCLKEKVKKLLHDDLDLVVGSFALEKQGQLEPFRFKVNDSHSLRDHLLMNTPFDARTSTFVVRRTMLEKISFDEKLKKHQDWDLFINIDSIGKTGFTDFSDVIVHISETDRISNSLRHDSTLYFIDKNKDKVSADALFLFELKMLYRSAIRDDKEGKQYYRNLVIEDDPHRSLQYRLISLFIRLKIVNVSFLHSLKRLLTPRR